MNTSTGAIGFGLAVLLGIAPANAEIVRRTSTSTLVTTGTSVTRSERDETGATTFLKEVRDVTQFALPGDCTSNCSTGAQTSEIRQVDTSASTYVDKTIREVNLNIDLTDVTDTLYLGSGQLVGQP